MASTQSLNVLSWIRGFHVYKGWWTPHNGESLQLQPEPENPKDRNAVSVVKDSRVVGHMPLMLVNTKEEVLNYCLCECCFMSVHLKNDMHGWRNRYVTSPTFSTTSLFVIER